MAYLVKSHKGWETEEKLVLPLGWGVGILADSSYVEASKDIQGPSGLVWSVSFKTIQLLGQ
jgi:hypothetical protein